MPPFCIKNREVTRMNAAHPFMLMVVQIDNTNRETLLDTPILVSAVFMVTGRVAAELFVKSAINTAGIILLSVRTGLMPLANRNNGKTMKNWMTLPPKMMATYLPNESITIPAENCAESWAAKATIPKGNAHIKPLISMKSKSCNPNSPFTTTSFLLLCGILAKAIPAAAAKSKMESTLPSANGLMILLGMTPKIWS